MHVVLGATGHTGQAAAESLLELGREVRVVVRDAARGEAWKARGAEVAVADAADAAALTAALAGAEGAYVLVPPQYGVDDMLAAQKRIIEALAGAVQRSGVPHVVLLSSIGAQRASGTGPIVTLHRAEEALRKSAKSLTALRAGFFLENWIPFLGAVREKNVLPSFIPSDRSVPMVATHDIGRTAADLLLEPRAGVRVVELSGPRDLTPKDVADALGRRVGHAVRVEPLPLEAVEPSFVSAGMSADVARLFREMYGALIEGTIAWEGGAAEVRRGRLGAEDVLGPML
jgi:uncharacterized protein YbjT (DUF2867 family)